jgi:hypothetical protein
MLRDAPLDLSVASLPTCAAEYRSGDIVWAKVKGFPWWPAKVCGMPRLCCLCIV